MDIPHSVEPLERAALLADPGAVPPARTRLDRIARRAARLSTPIGRTARRALLADKIIWPNGAPPPAPTIWHCSNIFADSNRCFRSFGTITPLLFESQAPAPDVFHWTTFLPIHARNQANVYTLHDLIPLRAPYTTRHDRAKYAKLCRAVFDKADAIVTISETTRKDAIEMLGVSEEKITTIYQATTLPPSIVNRSAKDIERDIETQFNLEYKKFFLFFGAIEPKKNLLRVIESILTSETSMPLVVVGHRGWSNEAENFHLKNLTQEYTKSAKRITHLDYLSETQLTSLIRGARATVFPSIYEGFGLPALESMMLGTPVLASQTPALAEVCGEAACYADPLDIASIRDAFTRLSRENAYCEELARKGQIRAAAFSPSIYAAKLGQLYASLR
ncbi:D-inositol 3-phosphate glycosyltransferase [compost metagenome]